MFKNLSSTLFSLSVLLPVHLSAGGGLQDSDNEHLTGTQLAQAVHDTSLTELNALRSKLEKLPVQEAAATLRPLLTKFEPYLPSDETEPLALYATQFTNYVKVLDLLYGLGDPESPSMYRKLYEATQEAVGDAIGGDEEQMYSVALYIFSYGCFALLNPEVRIDISQKYKNGIFPFPKDSTKASEYEKDFDLKLSPALFFTDS